MIAILRNNLIAALAGAVLLAACGGSVRAQEAPPPEPQKKRSSWLSRSKSPPPSAGERLAEIRTLFGNKKHTSVVSKVKKLIKAHPTSPVGQEALFLAGESELARGRYYQAYEWFEKQIARFPNGKLLNRALDREFVAAEALVSGKKRIIWGAMRVSGVDEGLDILARIAEHAPGTQIARKALMRIGDHHYAKSEWAASVAAYDLYVELHKNDPDAQYAMLQACRATRAQFVGVQYDDTPLLEAEQRYKAFAQRYPAAAAKEGVAKAMKDIGDLRARKMFLNGDFYKRTGRPRSAAYYYQQVIRQYGDSTWADRARQALGLLGDVRPEAPAGAPAAERTPVTVRDPRPRATTQPVRAVRTGQPQQTDDGLIPPPPPSEEGMVPTTQAGRVKETP